MPAVFLPLLFLFAIWAESTFLLAAGWEQIAWQSGLVATIYLGLERSFVVGGIVLATLLVPIEWFVSGPAGFYSLGLVVVYFLATFVRPHIPRGWAATRFIVAAVLAALHAATMLVMLILIEPDSRIIGAIAWQIVFASLFCGVATILTGLAIGWIDSLFTQREQGLSIERVG